MRNGEPIANAMLKNRVNTGITYAPGFEALDACIAAGMDVERWENREYDPGLMGRVIAWYRLHNYIEAHVKDASIAKSRRK